MNDGIHIGPWPVRLTLLALVLAMIGIGYAMMPEARRYLKIESM